MQATPRPQHFLQPTPLKLGRLHRIRAEGLPLQESVRSALPYLRKYHTPLRQASPEVIAWFDDERKVFCRSLQRNLSQTPITRLAIAGDLMWIRNGWKQFLDPAVLHWFNGHANVVANLETPISALHGIPSLLPDYFTYNSPPELVTSFRRPDQSSTFTALTTCNNHTLDRGDAGFRSTLDFLDREGIRHIGVRQNGNTPSWLTWERDGIRFGLYAACWGLNDPAQLASTSLQMEIIAGLVPQVHEPIDLTPVTSALEAMRQSQVDYKIVCLHWGYEFEFYPDPKLMPLAHQIVGAGADLIVGTHPHVVQPVERVFVNGAEAQATWLDRSTTVSTVVDHHDPRPRQAVIAYSLGNFTTAMFTPHCRTGLVLGLELGRDFDSGAINPIRIDPKITHMIPQSIETGGPRLIFADDIFRHAPANSRMTQRLSAMRQEVARHLGMS